MFRRFICWLLLHDYEHIVDNEERRSFQRCRRCLHEFQHDFERSLSKDWIGFAGGPNKCELCMGWKSRADARCGGAICVLNPRPNREMPPPMKNCGKCGEHLMFGLAGEL